MTRGTQTFDDTDTWPGMTPDELRGIIDNLALSQVGLARMLGVDGRSVRRWIEGSRHIPETAARLLRCAAAGEFNLASLPRHATRDCAKPYNGTETHNVAPHNTNAAMHMLHRTRCIAQRE